MNSPKKNWLHKEYVGRIIEIAINLIYGFIITLIFEGISYLELADRVEITLLIAAVTVVSLFKKMISEKFNMESKYNKEKIAHNETQILLQEKTDIIHAMISNINNTFNKCYTNDADIVREFSLFAQVINENPEINNVNTMKLQVEYDRKDYVSFFKKSKQSIQNK